jgi:hypothetical protein
MCLAAAVALAVASCQTLACALGVLVYVRKLLLLLLYVGSKIILFSCLGSGSCTLHITARQYGEVVLPDESTGQGPGTLASKLSRCEEGMAHFLPSGYKFY